eukprot:TRINITY_DN1257_c0_g1_i2.p1 TRINITY_DN1257_c0_g1~~TRINITY_DN1257_c0_g1_i2.p1  ORF type:complete len:194 (+),score=55.29 TRINITY_DN1257_c0_g1_i2:705-1286(+)
MWQKVAEKFNHFDHVIGYEILNEPWNGDNYKHPKFILESDKLNLQPFYQRVHENIRKVDNTSLLFFEPTSDDIPITFTDTPGGKDYTDRTVFSYHLYCNVPYQTSEEIKICNDINTKNMKLRTEFAQKYKINAYLTEFGAVSDKELELEVLDHITSEVEKKFQSWSYWQYKYYGDYTTAGGSAQSLYLSLIHI